MVPKPHIPHCVCVDCNPRGQTVSKTSKCKTLASRARGMGAQSHKKLAYEGKPAFTIGSTKSYDALFEAEHPAFKLGQRADYEGGWVWKTAKEADVFRLSMSETDPAKFSVYAILLPDDWETDVSAAPASDGVHRLLNDARILHKVTLG